MGNPDYQTLLSQIGDAVVANNIPLKISLENQAYLFVELLEDSEKELFEYVSSYDNIYTEGYATEYVAPLPGLETEIYAIDPDDPNAACLFSYVGIYVDNKGNFSGETPGITGEFICGVEYNEIPFIPDKIVFAGDETQFSPNTIVREFEDAPTVAAPPIAVSSQPIPKKKFEDCI